MVGVGFLFDSFRLGCRRIMLNLRFLFCFPRVLICFLFDFVLDVF